MKANIGTIDKSVRILIAAVIAVLFFTGVISGTLAIILFIVAAILLITAFISFCPIWHFLGISTKKKQFNHHKNNFETNAHRQSFDRVRDKYSTNSNK